MFFIGIFSSFIPYLVIAGIYLLGIGVYSLENRQVKFSKTDLQELLAEKDDLNNNRQKDSHSIFDWNDNFDSANSNRILKSFTQKGKKLHCFLHPPPQTGILKIIYFCRPPPLHLFF